MILCCGYDDAGNVIETHEHTGDFKECRAKLGSFTACSEPFAAAGNVIETHEHKADFREWKVFHRPGRLLLGNIRRGPRERRKPMTSRATQ